MNPVSNEISQFLVNRRIIFYLSSSDIKSRFRGSRLGIIWPILQQLAFSLGAGLIWSNVFQLDAGDFIPFLTLGFAIWGFIATALTEGCSSFVVAHGYLKQLPLSHSIFIFRTTITQVFFLALGVMTAIGVLVCFGRLSVLGLLMSLPGLGLLLFFGYAAIGSLAYLGLRYRDLQHGIAGILSLLFVLTPVIYPSDLLIKKGLSFAIYINPLASLIEIVRYPILHQTFADEIHYIISCIFIVALISMRFLLAQRWGRYVPFWS